ncbi:MAG: hypothetical protein ABEH86_07175 [Haloarcula sp.]
MEKFINDVETVVGEMLDEAATAVAEVVGNDDVAIEAKAAAGADPQEVQRVAQKVVDNGGTRYSLPVIALPTQSTVNCLGTGSGGSTT